MEEKYIPERIIDHNDKSFKVKWVGYDIDDTTWEPMKTIGIIQGLQDTHPQLIEQYWDRQNRGISHFNKHPQKRKKKKKKSSNNRKKKKRK